MARVAAIVGAGVIGAGWAARFLLSGWDVRVFDPDPAAEGRVREAVGRARLALPGLGETAPPPEGALRFCGLISETVKGAGWVQESVPERLELKQTLYRNLLEHAPADAVIASSSTGFTPSDLQARSAEPGRIVIARPLDPVYLVPLVELVHSGKNHPDLIDTARDTLVELGMAPIRVRAELPAHVAARLEEALWREALWLVRDGVVTAAELDDVVRLGPGLRWAQTGPFAAQRLAAEAERDAAAPFADLAAALDRPWSHLTDTPPPTQLSEMLAEQFRDTPAPAGAEALAARDRALVALLRGRAGAAGAPATAKADRLREEARGLKRRLADIDDPARPVSTVERAVPLDWLDYNGHMTEGRYLEAFGMATDRIMQIVGCDADYIAEGGSFFTVETHIRHLAEVRAGEPLHITSRVLSADGRKMRLWHEMRSGERLLATGEHMLLHVDLRTRRASEAAPQVAAAMCQLAEAQAGLPWPEGAGRAIGTPR